MAFKSCVKDKGKSNATDPRDITKLINFLKIKKNAVFCDLGCGNGELCIKASSRVREAIGIECDKKRLLVALKKTKKYDNIRIYKGDYEHKKSIKKIKNASVFFYINGVSLGFLKRLDKSVKKGTLYIQYDLPPCPVKPQRKLGWYYIMKTPFKMAKNQNDWIMSLKQGSLVDLKRKLSSHFKKGRVKEFKEDLKDCFS